MVHPKITTCYPSFHTESDTVNTFSKPTVDVLVP